MRQWSISAHNSFRRCQRQFFFKNIMAWHNAKDANRREAFVLSQLRGLEEWQGHLVHLALEKYFVPSLQNRDIISLEELTARTFALGRAQLEFSRRGDYKNGVVTKDAAGENFLGLREHEYGIEIAETEIERIFENIERCYDFLYSQEKFVNFLKEGAWYSSEPFLHLEVCAVPIVARLDLIVGYGNSKLCIIDWKIGASLTSDYSNQLRLYALAAINRWTKYKIEDVLLVEANLLQGKLYKHHVDEKALLEIEDFIYRSFSDMQVFTDQGKYADHNLDDYAYAKSPNSCKFCKFRRLCMRLNDGDTHPELIPGEQLSLLEL